MKMIKNKRNPILPLDVHIPDSEAHVMSDGKLYLYGSCDKLEDTYCSEEYYVVSTENMENWTVHDVSFTGEQVPWFYSPDGSKYPGIDWDHPTPFLQALLDKMEEEDDDMLDDQEEVKPLLFAPDCIEKDEKYYLYFCMSDDSEGVAVSESPTGPFGNPVQLPCGGIDPAVFLDDDGQAYYYWGQLFSHGVKLNPDMVSFDQSGIVDNLLTEQEHFFHEGSSMRKIGDIYYYVYADMQRGKPTALGYSTGKSPLGPFHYQGIIIDNDGCDPKSWNNHGSIECIGGQWYVFYHRCSRGTHQFRRLCVEPITINPDGTINEVKMTSQGAGEPFAPGEIIWGYQACGLKGSAYIDVDDTYGEKLTNISSGDEAVFRYVRSAREWTKIQVLCTGTGKITVVMNGIKAGEINIEGNMKEVKNISGDIRMPSGEYELLLQFDESMGLQIMQMILS